MKSNHGESIGREPGGDRLDALIKAAALKETGKFLRPSEDTIRAYLESSATEKQLGEMRAALLASRAFRREMNELSEGMRYFSSGLAADAFDGVRMPKGAVSQIIQGKVVHHREQESTQSSVLASVVDFFRPRLVRVSFAAAGAAVLTIVGYAVLSGPHLATVPFALMNDQGTYVAAETRGAGTSLDKPYDHREAARISFDRQTKEVDGKLELLSGGQPVGENRSARSISLQFVNAERRELAKIEFSIPPQAEDLHAWVATVRPGALTGNAAPDSLNTRSVQARKDGVKISWAPGDPGEGLVTFTYKLGESYEATDAVHFKF